MNNLRKVLLCSLPLLIATGCSMHGDAVAPVVTVEAVMESVAEGTPLMLTIRVAPPAKADLSVNLTWGDTASILSSPPRTVTVAAGRREITLTVDSRDGAVDGLAGTVTVMIADGPGYRGGSFAGTASVTVTDASDDETPPPETPPETPPPETPPETPPPETPPETPPPETPTREPEARRPAVTVAAAVEMEIEGGSGWFKVTATPAPATALTVNVAWEETGDVLAPERPSSVIVPTGGTANLRVPTIDDATEESDSRVTAIVGDGPGYAIGMHARATHIVLDNDRTVYIESVEPSPVREGETLRITIALSRPASVFFCFIVEASDSATGDDHIPGCVYESDSTATLHHTVVNDGTVTSERTVTVTMDDVFASGIYTMGTPHEVTVPVIDTVTDASDEETPPPETPTPEPQTRRPVVTVAAVVTTIPTKEGGSGWFRVTAAPAPATALTVNVAWEETGDMLAPERPSSVIVPPGGTANLWVPTIDDATEESDSRVTAILGDGPGYAIGMHARATRSVLDDDRTVYIESVEPSPVREGETLRITIALSRPASIFFCFSIEAVDSATGDDRNSQAQCVYESDSTATLHHTVVNDGTVTSERTVAVKMKHVLTAFYTMGTPHEVTVPVIDAG